MTRDGLSPNRPTWVVLSWLIAGVASAGIPHSANAVVFGDITAAGGVIWPQGSFAYYSDPGPNIFVRTNLQIPEIRVVMLWADLNGTFFATDNQQGLIEVHGASDIPITQSTQEYAVSFHVGLQTGSPTRHAFFRPRAAIGIGVYFFNIDRSWTGLNQDDPLAEENIDSQGRFGWRGILGSDFFFSTKWGISADLIYDHVWNLDQGEGPDVVGKTARFQGFAVGVVIPFQTIRDAE